MLPMTRQGLQQRIDKIKQQIAALGDLRPGALSQQYNVCGNPSCRCKATPPIKHGPYYQLSFTWKGKSSTRFVRDEGLSEMRQKVANYKRLRELVNEWVELAVELERAERAAAKQSNGD